MSGDRAKIVEKGEKIKWKPLTCSVCDKSSWHDRNAEIELYKPREIYNAIF